MKWRKPFSRELADEILAHDIRQAHERHARRLTQLAAPPKAPPPEKPKPVKNTERYSRALELRRSGKLLREIGAELGVSAGRARVMVAQARRSEKRALGEYDPLD